MAIYDLHFFQEDKDKKDKKGEYDLVARGLIDFTNTRPSNEANSCEGHLTVYHPSRKADESV